MIIGNKSAQIILKNFFRNIKEKGVIPYNFLLLEGQSNIGKTTLLKLLSKDFLGDHFKSDFLFIPDLSYFLETKHSIKISVDDKDQIIDIQGEGSYMDLGTRQIISWLSKSPIGKYKIVLLENIERMTLSAANSFLKTFEEPIPNTLILATTNNRNLILDTILSRAFVIKFITPSNEEIRKCLKDIYPDISEDRISLISGFSMNRIGFAKKIIENSGDSKGLDEVLDYYQKFIALSHHNGGYSEKMNILTSVNKNGFLKIFMEALVFYYTSHKDFEKADKIMSTIGKMETNVGIDNLLFEMIL